VQYGLRLAIIADVSRYVEESVSFRDFVRESNRGDDIWFLANADELQDRLARAEPSHSSPRHRQRFIASASPIPPLRN
jgi:Domain of unknown function (DUF4180)